MGRLATGRRTKRHRDEIIRGGVGLLWTLALIAGVPAALWLLVGWPLPHALPSLAEIRETLSNSSIPEDFFPSALAILSWLAWAQFVACLTVETRSALRGRTPRKVPGAGWGIQSLAANLVAAVMLLLPGQGVTAVALAATPAALVQTVQPHLRQPTGGDLPGPAAQALEERPQPRPTLGEAAPATHDLLPEYVVKRRETLWTLAERHLGDPLRWEEIFDLNKGRIQPDGRRLEDVNWIYPGWVLRLPQDAVGVPRRDAARVKEGQDLDPSPLSTSPPVPTTQPAAPSRPAADHGNGVVPPELPLPDVKETVEARTDKTLPGISSPTTGSAEGVTPDAPASRRPPEPEQACAGQLQPASLPRSGLLGAGAVALLTVLRIVQQRRRRSGRRIALPEADLAAVELALRAEEHPEQAELLELALRAMAAGMRRDGIEPPQVLGAMLGPEHLEVLLAAETAAAPEPFTLSPSRRRWRLPLDTPLGRLRELAGDMTSPLPALVTLGLTGNAPLLVNLEAPGLIALGGDETAARAVLSSFAVELATCRWADFLELVLVGFGTELERLERVHPRSSVMEVLPRLERKLGDIADALDEAGVRSVLGGRVAGATADIWTPTVLLCATPPTPEETARLVALTLVPSRSPVAAVIATKRLIGARWRLELPGPADQPLHLAPLDLDVAPQRLEAGAYRAVTGLLRAAAMDDVDPEPNAAAADAPVREPPAEDAGAARPSSGPGPPGPRQIHPAAQAEPAGDQSDEGSEVEVRVLGRIEIGGIERIERGKSEELVVFLALHPDGVDSDLLAEALWPGRPPARGTLNTTTAVARAYLGATPQGQPRLPHARNGVYRLDASVALDWARFQALAARGYANGQAGIQDLRRALELVRGRPFEGTRPRSYGWAMLDQVPVMEATIVDVADHLAGLLLAVGNPAGAQWAARRGLATAPYDERLYRKLMLAADAAGNPAGVEAVMDELLLRLDEENIEPYDSLHEETRLLYERLTRHRANPPHRNAG